MSGHPWGGQQAGGGSSAASPPRSPMMVPGATLLPTLAAATVASSSSPARRALVVSRRKGNGNGAAETTAAGTTALASADSGADRYFDALAGSRPVSDDEGDAFAGGGGAGSGRGALTDGDDDDEDYTPSSSGYTDDLIDEILENYRFTFQPEVRVKLRRRLPAAEGGVAMCACYSKPWQREPRWRFTVKPGRHGWGGRGLDPLSSSDERDDDDQGAEARPRGSSGSSSSSSPSLSGLGASVQRLASAHVRKLLVVPSLSSAMLFTSKVPLLGVLRLQLAAGYNWRRKAPLLEYRLTTKWGGDAPGGGGRLVRRKEEYRLSPACLLRAKWHLDAHFPDMEGHLGAAAGDGEGGSEGGREGGGGGGGRGAGGGPAAAIDVDYGGMHFEVSQLDVVLDF